MDINFSAALKNRLLAICSSTSDEDVPKENSSGFLANLFSSRFNVPALGCAAPALGVAGALLGSKKPEAEKNVKKTLTLPKWLNERAIAMNVNFSAELKEALLETCKDKMENKKN